MPGGTLSINRRYLFIIGLLVWFQYVLLSIPHNGLNALWKFIRKLNFHSEIQNNELGPFKAIALFACIYK